MTIDRKNAVHCRHFKIVHLLYLIVMVGCTGLQSDPDRGGDDTGQDVIIEVSTEAVPPIRNIPVEHRSILSTSQLSPLVEELDQVAVERSVSLQNLQASLAERRALEFERYPTIVPTASVPINGGDASIGINMEQTIWDGGRTRVRLGAADLTIDEVRISAWQERNETIHRGIKAFIDIQRYSSRVSTNQELLKDLQELNAILRVRVEGGVADRGEELRMTLSLQEVQRDVVSNQADMRAASAELARLVSQDAWPSGGGVLTDAQNTCSREWPAIEAPEVAQARVRLMLAENNFDTVSARRFPRIILGVGSSYSSNGLSDPAATFRVDASDMLGLGRRGSIEAAEASRTGALRSYELQKEDTEAELVQLEQDFIGYVSDISQLRALERTNVDNLALYEEQVVAGTIPIAEGISLFKERTNTSLALIDAQARVIQNCIESARVRGSLAPFGVSYGQ